MIEAKSDPQISEDFKRELVATLPHLRAFARGLSGRPDVADDLVQETAIKAWAARDRFVPGTNIRAWTFTILRNHFLSELRRNRHQSDYDPDLAERTLVMAPEQEDGINLHDLQDLMQKLAPERREALLLVGAGGFSYEEAAGICEVAVGTMKSRVARARATLAGMLASDSDAGSEPDLNPDKSSIARAPSSDPRTPS